MSIRTASVCFGCTAAALGTMYLKHWQKDVLRRRDANTHNYAPLPMPPPRSEMVANISASTKENPFDILVIGGGSTGASVALEGATRGIRVALVDRGDFASQTSMKSTKLLHGGIRYLENAFKNLDWGQMKLVAEALEERNHMLLASSRLLSKPLGFVLPLAKKDWWKVPYFWFGVKVYDFVAKVVCANRVELPQSSFVNASILPFLMPKLKTNGLIGGLLYFDGTHNDARSNLHILQTAATPGYLKDDPYFLPSSVANYVEVIDFIKDDKGKLIGASLQDQLTGKQFPCYANMVVNATGVFGDDVRKKKSNTKQVIVPSQGSHASVSQLTPNGVGLVIPKTKDGRIFFVLPWQGGTVAGTTDMKMAVTTAPQTQPEEMAFINEEIQTNFDTSCSVKSTWAGIRPLVQPQGAGGNTAKISRTHEIIDEGDGLLSILGGKWTTCRRMAQDVVDYIGKHPPKAEKFPSIPTPFSPLLHPSRSWAMKWAAATSSKETKNIPPNQLAEYLSNLFGLGEDVAQRLTSTYGYRAYDVCKLGTASNTLKPVKTYNGLLEAEIVWACKNEWACRPSDIIGRRAPVALLSRETATELLPEVARVMGAQLGWSSSYTSQMIKEGEGFLNTLQPAKSTSLTSSTVDVAK